MHSLLVLSKIFEVFPQHVSRTFFTLCMLFEHSGHEFNRNIFNHRPFISSIQTYSSNISFYPFPKENRMVTSRKVMGYFLEISVMESTVSFKTFRFMSRHHFCTFRMVTAGRLVF